MSIAASHEGKSKSKSHAVLKDADFNWEDPLDLDGDLTEEERMVRDTARGYAQDKLMPKVIAAYRNETVDRGGTRDVAGVEQEKDRRFTRGSARP